jgi:hypothetical protein
VFGEGRRVTEGVEGVSRSARFVDERRRMSDLSLRTTGEEKGGEVTSEKG